MWSWSFAPEKCRTKKALLSCKHPVLSSPKWTPASLFGGYGLMQCHPWQSGCQAIRWQVTLPCTALSMVFFWMVKCLQNLGWEHKSQKPKAKMSQEEIIWGKRRVFLNHSYCLIHFQLRNSRFKLTYPAWKKRLLGNIHAYKFSLMLNTDTEGNIKTMLGPN